MKQVLFLLVFLTLFIFTKAQENGVPAGYVTLKNPVFKSVSEAEGTDIGEPKILSLQTDSNKVVVTVDLINDGHIFYKELKNADICNLRDSDCPIKKFVVKKEDKNSRDAVAIAVVADHSGSMGEDNARELQKAILELVENKNKDDNITIIKFDHRVRTIVQSSDLNVIHQKFGINGLEDFGGETALKDGLLMGVEKLKSLGPDKYKRKILIAFTDGFENFSYLGEKDEIIQTAKENGITIYTADFGGKTDKKFMKEIADKTNGYYYHIFKKEELVPLFKNMNVKIDNKYIIEFPYCSFGKKTFNMDVCLKNQKLSLSKDFEIPLVKGNAVTLDVKFDFNKSTVKDESLPLIADFANFVNQYPEIEIELSGHTDTVGSHNYNNKLSQARADAVKQILVEQHNVKSEKLVAIGYGKTIVMDTVDMDMNRRVEAKVLKIETNIAKPASLRQYEIRQVESYISRNGDDWKNDTLVMKILTRNPKWKNILAVTDWSSSMYKYGAQVLLWHQYNYQRSGVKYFSLYNDGVCFPRPAFSKRMSFNVNMMILKNDVLKPYGRGKGVYYTKSDTNIDSLLMFFKKVERTHLCNNDMAENATEAIVKATRHFQNFNEIVLIADNGSCIRDIHLLNNIKVPVHVIICGGGRNISKDLVEIAYRTKGSLHTDTKDIDFGKEKGMSKHQVLRKYLAYEEDLLCGTTPLWMKYKLKIKTSKKIKSVTMTDEFYDFDIELEKKKDYVYKIPILDPRNIIITVNDGTKEHKFYMDELKFSGFSRTYKVNLE